MSESEGTTGMVRRTYKAWDGRSYGPLNRLATCLANLPRNKWAWGKPFYADPKCTSVNVDFVNQDSADYASMLCGGT